MDHAELIANYLAGPGQLRDAVAGMTAEQLDAAPIAGKWSTRQVVCHLADFEPVYADRMKRAIVQDNPPALAGDPNVFARLAYDQRDVAEELNLIEAVRGQMGRILRTLREEDFQRTVIHSDAGPLTIRQLLTSVTNHIPHHIRFIEEKRAALGL
jgi:uncharacterized damage-inducible protein DinB